MKALRHGDRGDDVGLLQQRLQRAGYAVVQTNVYDDATERAVMALQVAKNLVVDGIYGPKSFMALVGAPQARHLSDLDLARAAERLGVPLATVRAVNEVESRGEGFLPDGRPVILFERHQFYKQLQKHGIDPAPIAAKFPNICNPEYGGYRGGEAEYQRLDQARKIHLEAAYESASWGSFQVMGYHAEALGYPGVVDFVRCMYENEAAHLEAFVRYVIHFGLAAPLKARKWAKFAEGYNGPAYARNLYDTKLARAYDKYSALEKVAA
jgi:hypothetical protein